MNKYIKMDALERLAKPMEELHKEDTGKEKDMPKMGEHDKCECPCCGAPCEACNEADEEDSEEYADEEDSEEDSEDE